MKLTKKLTSICKKYGNRIFISSLAVAFLGAVAISESQKIGCYRPEGLNDAMTSYCAYDKGNEIWLYMPAIPGMINGPIIDYGKDGSIEYVGSLKYPRVPIGTNLLKFGTPEQKQKRLQKYQTKYNNIMEKIKKSSK